MATTSENTNAGLKTVLVPLSGRSVTSFPRALLHGFRLSRSTGRLGAADAILPHRRGRVHPFPSRQVGGAPQGGSTRSSEKTWKPALADYVAAHMRPRYSYQPRGAVRSATPMPNQNHFRINAIAFKEGDAWVIQGIEYDIVAHAYDVTKLPQAFMRAVVENMIITQHLGRAPFQGIKPAPERFRSMFEDADTEMRPLKKMEEWPDVAVRVMA
jgi:hypothetical protein